MSVAKINNTHSGSIVNFLKLKKIYINSFPTTIIPEDGIKLISQYFQSYLKEGPSIFIDYTIDLKDVEPTTLKEYLKLIHEIKEINMNDYNSNENLENKLTQLANLENTIKKHKKVNYLISKASLNERRLILNNSTKVTDTSKEVWELVDQMKENDEKLYEDDDSVIEDTDLPDYSDYSDFKNDDDDTENSIMNAIKSGNGDLYGF